MKKKTIIIIISIIIFVIAILSIILLVNNNLKKGEETESTKTEEISKEITNSNQITFTKILDDLNKETIMVKDDKAYKETVVNGKTNKYIIKDGNTYYLNETEKKYYIFKNNNLVLTEIKEQLERIQQNDVITGKEKINGKTYNYEEFGNSQDFLINKTIAMTDEAKAKTRLYYSNDKLQYIKTILKEKEELLKINVTYNNINEDYFKIPSDYKKAN